MGVFDRIPNNFIPGDLFQLGLGGRLFPAGSHATSGQFLIKDSSGNWVPHTLVLGDVGSVFDATAPTTSAPGDVAAAGAAATAAHRDHLHGRESVTGIRNATPALSVAVFNTASSSIASGTTVIPWPSEFYDTDAMHDTVTNNSRLTCVKAGKYIVTYTLFFSGVSTTSYVIGEMVKNTTNIYGVSVAAPVAAIGDAGVSHSIVMDLAVNDYVEVYAQSNGAGALTMYNGSFYNTFSMAYVGT